MNAARVTLGIRRRAALLAAASPVALAACGRVAGPAAAPAAPAVATDPLVVTLRASEFAFSAPTVRVQVNRPARLVMENGGLLEHDVEAVRLPARDIRSSGGPHGHGDGVAAHAAPGGQSWVEFTPTRKGSYALECTIAGHKQAGMKGTLIVE